MSQLFMNYPKLTNHYAVDKSRVFRDQMDAMYYATEKVDGTNINLHIDVDTGEYVFGKRTSTIERGDTPFDSVYDLYDPKMISDIIVEFAMFEGTKIHMYGELYGSKIQKTNYDLAKEGKRGLIWYDIIIERNDGVLMEMSMDTLLDLIPSHQQPIVIGEPQLLEDWLNYFTPSDESNYGGISEGVVLKPVSATQFDEGHYPVVKYKTKAFAEVRKQAKPKKRVSVDYPELLESILSYVTEQRFEHVISHGELPEVNIKYMGDAIKLMQADIFEEFMVEDPSWPSTLVKEYINRYTPKTIAKVIRQRLLQG